MRSQRSGHRNCILHNLCTVMGLLYPSSSPSGKCYIDKLHSDNDVKFSHAHRLLLFEQKQHMSKCLQLLLARIHNEIILLLLPLKLRVYGEREMYKLLLLWLLLLLVLLFCVVFNCLHSEVSLHCAHALFYDLGQFSSPMTLSIQFIS